MGICVWASAQSYNSDYLCSGSYLHFVTMLTLVFISSNLLGCLIASVTLSNVDSHTTFPLVKNDKGILTEIVGMEEVGALLEKVGLTCVLLNSFI